MAVRGAGATSNARDWISRHQVVVSRLAAFRQGLKEALRRGRKHRNRLQVGREQE